VVRVLSDRFHQHRSLKVGDIGRLLHSWLRSPNLCHRGGPTRPTASTYCDWLSSTQSSLWISARPVPGWRDGFRGRPSHPGTGEL